MRALHLQSIHTAYSKKKTCAYNPAWMNDDVDTRWMEVLRRLSERYCVLCKWRAIFFNISHTYERRCGKYAENIRKRKIRSSVFFFCGWDYLFLLSKKLENKNIFQ